MYQRLWGRGALMLAAPIAALAVLLAVLLLVPAAAVLAVDRAGLLVLVVLGGLFAYHVAVVADAFAATSGRRAGDVAILLAVLVALSLAYLAAYRETRSLAVVVAGVFDRAGDRVIGPGIASGGTSAPTWSGTDRLNVAVLGLDTRDGGDTFNTDTIVVMSVDPVTKTAAMLSVPRDTLVDIPGVGRNKVNAAYQIGGERGGEVARSTLERLLGIPIHAYAVIDFVAFRQTIDSVGGVIIDVRRPLRDEAYPTADGGVERIAFRAGPQRMDGETALEFSRSRHESNDFGRAARQQQVIFAVRERISQLGVFRLPSIVERVGPLVRTSFDPANVLPLARLALSVNTRDIKSGVLLPCGADLPHCELAEINEPSGYYLVPDQTKVRAYVTEMLGGAASAR